MGSTSLEIYGSLVIGSGTTWLYPLGTSFKATSAKTITTNGASFPGLVSFNGVSGSWTLQDDFSCSGAVGLSNGTLDANDFNFTAQSFSASGASARSLSLGNGTWIVSGSIGVPDWNIQDTTNLTFAAEGSTIKFTDSSAGDKTFAGGGLTYNNFWNATGSTGVCIITGSNTFNDFKINAGRTQQFTAATTTTLTTLTAVGAGTVITSATAAQHTLSAATGIIIVQNCTISQSIATGGAIWEADTAAGNVDGGSNSGWLFAIPEIQVLDGAVEVTSGQSNVVNFPQGKLNGPSPSMTFTINNTGTATLTISSVTVPSGFTITTDPTGTIAASGTAPLVVARTGTTGGSRNGNITINSDDADEAAFAIPVVGMVSNSPRGRGRGMSHPRGRG